MMNTMNTQAWFEKFARDLLEEYLEDGCTWTKEELRERYRRISETRDKLESAV